MYYLVDIKGKQYKIKEGDTLLVDNLNQSEGQTVEIDKVLAIASDEAIVFGTPYISNKRAVAVVEKTLKGKKIVVFKYRHKVNWKKKKGFRPILTKIKVEKLL